MYYTIDWNGLLCIYDSTTKSLSSRAGSDILEAITLFNQRHWDITKWPEKFTLTDKALLEHTSHNDQPKVYTIIYSLPSIDLTYLQQHYPELLI